MKSSFCLCFLLIIFINEILFVFVSPADHIFDERLFVYCSLLIIFLMKYCLYLCSLLIIFPMKYCLYLCPLLIIFPMKYCQLCWLCQATLAAYSSDTLHWRATIMNRDDASDGNDGDDDD